jgi:hypothetical protein
MFKRRCDRERSGATTQRTKVPVRARFSLWSSVGAVAQRSSARGQVKISLSGSDQKGQRPLGLGVGVAF